MSPDDAPAPAGRTGPACHAAATIVLAVVLAFVGLVGGLGDPGPVAQVAGAPVAGVQLAGADDGAVVAVEAAGEDGAGEWGGDDATRHRILRPMWTAVLPVVALAALVTLRRAQRRKGAEPRPDRAHPGRAQAVRPPPARPVRLLA